MIFIPTPEIARALAAQQAEHQNVHTIYARPDTDRVKPRLRHVFNVEDAAYEWRCSDSSECYAMGWGPTREAAYEQWLARFAHCRRSRAQ